MGVIIRYKLPVSDLLRIDNFFLQLYLICRNMGLIWHPIVTLLMKTIFNTTVIAPDIQRFLLKAIESRTRVVRFSAIRCTSRSEQPFATSN